ncbi:MAG: M20/M25/M40 family metallo-hydrolase [Rhizomicrobium sp.]
MDLKSSGTGLRLVALALVAVAIWFAGATFDGLPRPLGADAPATEFSAARAYATLGRLLGPEVPHPVSSPANKAVQGRVRAEFAALGIRTSLYRGMGCEARADYGFFACGTAEDIIAEVAPGAGKAIVLVAHYDSVPAGPGAGDDQSSVATILETVRALQARGMKTKHPIIALLTDGEEAGLLGAHAFLDNPVLRARVGIAINAEGRGNQGPSLLFQTSPGDGPLIDLYAKNVPAYATGSLFAVIYKMLPNDTDLTVFLDHGLPGYNFSFLGHVADYHTAQDRRANLSQATLQSHGDSVLGVASGLMQADFVTLKGGDDIYLTLFGKLLPHLPASRAVPLAILVLAMLLAAAWLSRVDVAGIGRWLAAFSIPLVAVAGSALLGWFLHVVAATVSGGPDPSYAYPAWLRIALALGIAAVMLPLSRWASVRLTALSVWTWIGALGLLTAVLVPGVSPYFLFPGLIGAAILLVQTRLRGAWSGAAGEIALFIAALPMMAVWLSLASTAETVQGLALHPLFTVPVAFGVLPLVPLLAARPLRRIERNTVVAALAAAALAFAIVAGLSPAYSAYAPQRLNIDFVDDHETGGAFWAADAGAPLPKALRAVAPFGAKPVMATPLAFQKSYVAPAGALRYAEPRVAVTAQPVTGGRSLTLTFRGSPQADRMVILVPKEEGLLRAEIDGHVFLPAARSLNPVGTIIACVTADCRDKSVKLVFWRPGPKHLVLGEQHFGLPSDGAKFEAARPAEAVASQSGDTTIVFTRLVVR